ncbi:hypothetical protein [Nocardia sp. Marseille-Q1738]
MIIRSTSFLRLSAKDGEVGGLTSNMRRGFYWKPYTATVASVEPDGHEHVYDVAVADVHAFEGNGIMLRSCGEITVAGHTGSSPFPSSMCPTEGTSLRRSPVEPEATSQWALPTGETAQRKEVWTGILWRILGRSPQTKAGQAR